MRSKRRCGAAKKVTVLICAQHPCPDRDADHYNAQKIIQMTLRGFKNSYSLPKDVEKIRS